MALIQEIFLSSEYNRINSLLEIVRQTAPVVCGGLSVYIIQTIPLTYIILIDLASYIMSFFLFLFIPYRKKKKKSFREKKNLWFEIKEGFQYLKSSPSLFWFFLFAAMPYISIMIGNYLNPIFISKQLKVSGNVYAMQELVLALRAILAGLISSYLVNKIGLYKSICTYVLIFTCSLFLMVLIPNTTVF